MSPPQLSIFLWSHAQTPGGANQDLVPIRPLGNFSKGDLFVFPSLSPGFTFFMYLFSAEVLFFILSIGGIARGYALIQMSVVKYDFPLYPHFSRTIPIITGHFFSTLSILSVSHTVRIGLFLGAPGWAQPEEHDS